MVEIIARSLEEILSAFSPQEKTITYEEDKRRGMVGVVAAYYVSRDPNHVSQDPKGLILYAAPEAVWLKRVEEQKNRATA